jgi:hypothetical protein
VSLNHDNSPCAVSLNALISRKFEFGHGICLRTANVPLGGIMTLAWIEKDFDL